VDRQGLSSPEIRELIRLEKEGTAASRFAVPGLLHVRPSANNPANWDLDINGMLGPPDAIVAMTHAARRVQAKVDLIDE
jgi:hypothetical protein